MPILQDPDLDRQVPHSLMSPDRLRGVELYAQSIDDALARLDTGRDGLSDAEAERRLHSFGANRLPERRRTPMLVVYLRQFKSPLIYLLLAAAAVSVGIGQLTDASFIFAVLQINAVIGAVQEWRAESSALALDRLVQSVTVVHRDGQRQRLDSVELVPGDIVEIESGDRIPADIRLMRERELVLDESLLTGESTPVVKDAYAHLSGRVGIADRANMLHAGTTALRGRAMGVIVATGSATEIGAIADALAVAHPAPPPLIIRLKRLARQIGILMTGAIALIAAAQLLQGAPLAQVFLVAVALAVAAIPEGLPVAITVALSIATARMAARRVIVRALPAVEGLGACTLIASDKTGTLTCNELTIKRIQIPGFGAIDVSGEGYAPEGGLRVAAGDQDGRALERAWELAVTGALCNEASLEVTTDGVQHLGDTVDVAFLALAGKVGLNRKALTAERPQTGIIPYEPDRRYAASFRREPDGGHAVHVKGAAETVIPMCAFPKPSDAAAALAQAEALATDGYRVLAVARGAVTAEQAVAASPKALCDLNFLGFVGLIDPLRPGVVDAIQQCRRSGIAVRMVTGDHPATALAIGRLLGLAETKEQVVTGAELADSDDAPAGRMATIRVFARVEPMQKYDIVRTLQAQGHFVAVTGDGANDAPALNAAHIGVAMGKGGTDIARGASDLIVADDNFTSIVAGVEEGRIAYDNVRKVSLLLIGTGVGEIVLFLFALLAALPLPLFAVQLLWLNLVTNGIQHVALAFERGEPGILDRQPRPPDQPLFDRRMVEQVALSGTFIGAAAFAFYYWALSAGMPEGEARTALLLLMVVFENVHVFNCRSERRSTFRIPVAANPLVVIAVVAALGLHVAAMYLPVINDVLRIAPLDWHSITAIAPIALGLLLVMEIYKIVRR